MVTIASHGTHAEHKRADLYYIVVEDTTIRNQIKRDVDLFIENRTVKVFETYSHALTSRRLVDRNKSVVWVFDEGDQIL